MNTGMLTNVMGAMGRGGDTMIAHLSHGDVVIPREIVLQNPDFLTKFKKAMQDNQADYRGHIAGSGYENYNPETGAPEFFFKGLRNFFSNPGKQISQAISNPIGTLQNSLATGVPIVGQAAAALLAPFAPTTQTTPTYTAPSVAAPAPSPNLTAQDQTPIDQPFTPKRGEEPVKPYDLFSRDVGGQNFGTLDPMQQRSYLATQGTQGGGLGDEDKNYYLGLLKRNLIDESGQLGNINTSLLPIERNYLSRLGLPTDNTTEFFQALQS